MLLLLLSLLLLLLFVIVVVAAARFEHSYASTKLMSTNLCYATSLLALPPLLSLSLVPHPSQTTHCTRSQEGFLGSDCVLEPSFFAWYVGPLDPKRGNVGSNFGLPHRDYPASEALFAPGEAPDDAAAPGCARKPKLLSVWVPLNAATLDNGCMYAVPREFDHNFEKHEDQAHMRSAGEVRPGVYKIRFPLHGARPLPAAPGSVLCWNGNTVHWGASCSRHTAAEPRKSMAMTFRRSAVAQLEGGGEPITRGSADPSAMSPEMRLSLIARSLLLYSQWYTLKDTAVPPVLYATTPAEKK